MERVLRPSLERRIVDMDEAEAFAEAEAPFEIVEQRPDEIAANVDSGRDGVEYRAEIATKIFDALAVMDLAVARHLVGKGGAVFGDVDRQVSGITLPGVGHSRQERVRRDFPTHLGDRALWLGRHLGDTERVVSVLP